MNRKRICIYFYAILCSFRIKILIFNVIFLLFFLFWLKRFGTMRLCIRKYCDNNKIACNMNNFEANLRLSRTDLKKFFLCFFFSFLVSRPLNGSMIMQCILLFFSFAAFVVAAVAACSSVH